MGLGVKPCIGMSIQWSMGNGREGYTAQADTGPAIMVVRSIGQFYRPVESDNYRVYYGKAKRVLGW